MAARRRALERTAFVVRAYLAGWQPEKDGDIHLILADPDQQTVTMIAEIPDPSGIAWSANGRRIGLWTDSLVVDQGSPQITTHHHWRLHLIDAAGDGDRVAVGADALALGGSSGTALSQDGRRAAFVFQGQIQAQDLP